MESGRRFWNMDTRNSEEETENNHNKNKNHINNNKNDFFGISIIRKQIACENPCTKEDELRS
jgi:hypothetical protein